VNSIRLRLLAERTDVLRRMVQTWAFCLVLSALQYGFSPERPYEIPLVYSMAIGTCTWACMDFGRLVLPNNEESGWPHGGALVGLIATGIVVGYLGGTAIADRWFGWSSWDQSIAFQRTSWLITLLAGLVASYFFYHRSRAAVLETRVESTQRQAAEATLRLLQAQLEPHMLFNTLANLRVLIATDPAAATTMLDRLIAYLRATLQASRSTEHALSAEFDRLRDFLELMKVRMGPRLQYELKLPAELSQRPVPPLLLQPLVENAIKHGLEPHIQGGCITVSAEVSGATLLLKVHDNGSGTTSPDPGTGFGLRQVRERLATVYGDRAQVEFSSSPGQGCTVVLHLPMTP